jgi:hypothetical protein
MQRCFSLPCSQYACQRLLEEGAQQSKYSPGATQNIKQCRCPSHHELEERDEEDYEEIQL